MLRHSFHETNLFLDSLKKFRVFENKTHNVNEEEHQQEQTLMKVRCPSPVESLTCLNCDRNKGLKSFSKTKTLLNEYEDVEPSMESTNNLLLAPINETYQTDSKWNMSSNASNLGCHPRVNHHEKSLKLPNIKKDSFLCTSNKSQNMFEKRDEAQEALKKSLSSTPHHGGKRVSLLPAAADDKHHDPHHSKKVSLTPAPPDHHSHGHHTARRPSEGTAGKDDPDDHVSNVFRTKSTLLLNDEQKERKLSSVGKLSYSSTDTTPQTTRTTTKRASTADSGKERKSQTQDHIKHVGHRLFSIMSQQQSHSGNRKAGRRDSIYTQSTTRVMRLLQAFLDEYMEESGFTVRKELVVTPSMRFHLFRYLAREDHDPDDCFAADRELHNACNFSNEERNVKSTFPKAQKTTGLSEEAVIFNTREECTSNHMSKRLMMYVKAKRDEWYETYEGRKGYRKRKEGQ